jgi:4'-phosphopantetheinyl transferase
MRTLQQAVGLAVESASGEGADRLLRRWGREADQAAATRRNPAAARRSRLARASLRGLLADLAGIDGDDVTFAADGRGKPEVRLASGRIVPAIAISDSGDLVAVAATFAGELGVDIERHRFDRPFRDLAEFAFGPKECRASTSPAAFYRTWTLREAMAKATGDGLRLAADRKDRFVGGPRYGCWRVDTDDSRWLVACLDSIPGHSLAVAVRRRSREADVRWQPDSIIWWRPRWPSHGR